MMIETFQFCYNSAVLVFTFISDLTNFKVLFIIHCKKVSYIYLYHDLLAQSLRIVNFAIILIESCVEEGNTSGPYIPESSLDAIWISSRWSTLAPTPMQIIIWYGDIVNNFASTIASFRSVDKPSDIKTMNLYVSLSDKIW